MSMFKQIEVPLTEFQNISARALLHLLRLVHACRMGSVFEFISSRQWDSEAHQSEVLSAEREKGSYTY